MKVATPLLITLQALLMRSAEAAACNKRGSCNADNCARAATGTFDGKQSLRTAACSSFQQCTVIPAATTITNIVNITPAPVTEVLTVTTVTDVVTVPTTVTLGSTPQKREVGYGNIIVDALEKRATVSSAAALVGATTICPTAVPATASACSGTVRYASACSCFGFTKTYTTVAAPSTTVTVTSIADAPTQTVPVQAVTTVTALEVATVTPLAMPTSFRVLLGFSNSAPAAAAAYAGTFLSPDNGFGEWSASSVGRAIDFQLDNTNLLTNFGSANGPTDRMAVIVGVQKGNVIVWDTKQHYQASHVSFPFLHCTFVPSTVVPGGTALACTGGTGSNFVVCDANQWNSIGGAGQRPDAFIMRLSDGESQDGCYAFEPQAIPLP